MSKVIQCPHRVTLDGMIYHCMQGHFPIDCENCDCKDKRWVEVWSDINAREL